MIVVPSALNAAFAARATFCATRMMCFRSSGLDVEHIARRRLRDDQRVSVDAGHDVHENQALVVFIDLLARQLAAQDLGEDIVGIVSR